MKRIWHIAFMDIRIMVRDKVYFFWTLLFPLVFIFIFGNLYKSDSNVRSQAQLLVMNLDQGKWGEYFIKKLESPGLSLKIIEEEPEKYNRILVIPGDFSDKILEKKSQQLVFKKREGANIKAAAQVEIKIVQATAKLITEMILHPDTATFFDRTNPFRDIIQVKSGFPEDTLTKVPTGFDHVIPGTMVQFMLMMVFIYGGISVMIDRQKGNLSRILYSSVSIGELWGGKFLGRIIMALLQALILIVTGILFFRLNLGNVFLSVLNLLVFSVAIASLSIFLGSVFSKEDLLVGVSVLMANMFAALGGCWWPIEIVPQSVRVVGMVSPAYWAMDGFHQVIFFNKGFGDILPNLLVLLGFGAIFTFLALKYFKVK
ncbi:MAG: ABC transporter permease [bacterium]|nr:ABC transporter permease [bacterium]